MAQLIVKHKGDITFACYSERGIIAHLMFRVLPEAPDEFLRLLVFPQGVPNPFAAATRDQLKDVVLFSEMDFGNVGFGKPDGAIAFRLRGTAYFVFLEGKANETYAKSCKEGDAPATTCDTVTPIATMTGTVPTPGEAQAAAGYNSTIRGQLELRYRMVRLLKRYPEEAFRPLTRAGAPAVTPPSPAEGADAVTPPPADQGRRDPCLRETTAVRDFYREKDGFYSHPKRTDPQALRSWRHLWIRDGVEKVFAYLRNTDEDNIHFLTFTKEATNPYDSRPDLLPEFFDSTWEVCKQRFPWITSQLVENKWDGM